MPTFYTEYRVIYKSEKENFEGSLVVPNMQNGTLAAVACCEHLKRNYPSRMRPISDIGIEIGIAEANELVDPKRLKRAREQAGTDFISGHRFKLYFLESSLQTQP